MLYIMRLISLRKPKRYQVFKILHNYRVCNRIKKEILNLRNTNTLLKFKEIVCEFLSLVNTLKDNGFDVIYHLQRDIIVNTSFPKVCLKFKMDNGTEVSIILNLDSLSKGKSCSIGYQELDGCFKKIAFIDNPNVVEKAEDVINFKYQSIAIDYYSNRYPTDCEVLNATMDFIIESLLVIFKEFLYINQ